MAESPEDRLEDLVLRAAQTRAQAALPLLRRIADRLSMGSRLADLVDDLAEAHSAVGAFTEGMRNRPAIRERDPIALIDAIESAIAEHASISRAIRDLPTETS